MDKFKHNIDQYRSQTRIPMYDFIYTKVQNLAKLITDVRSQDSRG